MNLVTFSPAPAPVRNASSEAGSSGQAELLAGYPDLLTVGHVCELTGLSSQTVRKEINAGRLPGCRIGRRLYVPKPSFLGFIMEGGGMDAYRTATV